MQEEARKRWICDVKEIIDLIHTKFEYGDILFSKTTENRIVIDDENSLSEFETQGVKIRIWDGEGFHEYCSSNIDDHFLYDKVETMVDSIKRINNKKFRADEKINKRFLTKSKKDPRLMTIEQKINKLKSLRSKFEHHNDISHSKMALIEEWEEKIFVSKHKVLSQDMTNEILVTLNYVQTAKGLENTYDAFFGHGIEIIDLPASKIKKILRKTIQLKKSKTLEPGKYTCVLSPHLSGLLAHESFGHGMEADTMLKGMCLAKEYVGQKLAPNFVNIVENPALEKCHGSYFFDDEGEISSKTYLMENGFVKTPISDLYSAYHLKSKKTANGRCESFDHKIYARMSNTYFEPGKHKKEDLFKDVEDGLYLHTAGGGMEDPKGWGIQIQGILAEKIKKGKLTGELYTNITMTGYLPTILNNIKKIADDLEVTGTGRCGKQHKEWVRVAEGGPHILIEEVELA